MIGAARVSRSGGAWASTEDVDPSHACTASVHRNLPDNELLLSFPHLRSKSCLWQFLKTRFFK